MRWKILSKRSKSKSGLEDVKNILLKNRGVQDEKDFFAPPDPQEFKIGDLGIKKEMLDRVFKRIEKAKKNKEKVIIYGDYDADGVCSTAILWEALYKYGLDVLPYIPDRFTEGYGINPKSVEGLDEKTSLVITIDNGIVAYDGIKKAKELGIDVIVIDHHQKGNKKVDTPYIIHSTAVCASALSYFFVKEFSKDVYLDLATIGTIADQMPLIGINRSIVKHGLVALTKTKRLGLLKLFKDAGIEKVGTYEVNYIIAPRINAMGRLKNGIEALRLLCTRDIKKAGELSSLLNKTNSERQKIVEEVFIHTQKSVSKNKVIVMAHESYHEGVIGLAAGRLAEEFYRPAIVISKGEAVSKGSARSIPDFNIIDNLRRVGDLLIQMGGHPMAAGFSIETKNIERFNDEINKLAEGVLTDEVLEKKMMIDCEIEFKDINLDLQKVIRSMEPFGQGNYPPVFCSKGVEIVESKKVGQEGKHLKLKLKQNLIVLDAVWFNASPLPTEGLSDVAFSVDENVWNGKTSLQLKVRDITRNP